MKSGAIKDPESLVNNLSQPTSTLPQPNPILGLNQNTFAGFNPLAFNNPNPFLAQQNLNSVPHNGNSPNPYQLAFL